MKEDDFNNLVKSIKQAGKIKNGQLKLPGHLNSTQWTLKRSAINSTNPKVNSHS